MSGDLYTSYGLDPDVEAVLVARMASSPALFARLGRHLDPAKLGSPVAQEAVRTIQRLAAEGVAVKSPLTVRQAFRAQIDEGMGDPRIIREWVYLLDGATDYRTMTDDEIVAVVGPVVRRDLQVRAASDGLDAVASKNPDKGFEAVRRTIEQAGSVGRSAVSAGLGADAMVEALQGLGALDCLPTGIQLIDDETGGLPRGEVGMYVAGTGAGKSTWLTQQLATAVVRGISGALITVELPAEKALARFMACLTGHTVSYVREHPAEVAALIHAMNLPFWRIAKLDSDTTTMADVAATVAAWEDLAGGPIGLLCVDYIDRLDGETDNTALAGKNLVNAMIDWAAGTGRFSERSPGWLWTASQTRGRDEGRTAKSHRSKHRGGGGPYVPDHGDVAESIWKVKAPGYVIYAGVHRPEGGRKEIRFRIGKAREADDLALLGPLPTQYAKARVAESVYLDDVPMPRRGRFDG